MFNSSSIVALAGNIYVTCIGARYTEKVLQLNAC